MATLFLSTDTPANEQGFGAPIVTSMAFFVSTAVNALGVRFWKEAGANTTTHTVNLWDVATQTSLAQAVSTGEVAGSGWAELTFSAPVALTANKAYRVSVLDPNASGYYAYTTSYFTSSVTRGIITGYADNTVPAANEPNGSYVGAGTPTYPSTSGGGANFWVDVRTSDPAANIAAIGIASTASLGTPALSYPQNISATGIGPTASFGTPVIANAGGGLQKISATLFIGRTNLQGVAAQGIDPTATFGAPVLTPGGVSIAAQGFGPTSSAGTPAMGPANPVFISTSLLVGRIPLSIQAIGIGPATSVGNPGIFLGNPPLFITTSLNVGLTVGQPISPPGIGPGTQVGLPAITTGSVNIAASGIAPTAVVGLPVLTLGGQLIAALAVPPTASFGLAVLTTGSTNIAASGIPSTASVGAALLIVNTANINALGIAPTASVGTPIPINGDLILPIGINSTFSAGLARVYLGLGVVAQGIDPTSMVGIPALQSDQFISAIGTGPATQVGLPFVFSRVIIPPEDGPVLMPPYTGQPQQSQINVPAHIAYQEAQREEGPWVIPPYANLYPQEPQPSVDVVPPPVRKSDLWSAQQEWPL